jgi:two-component system, NarL family, nitrate/nitrite response regulator NarL
MRMSRILIVAIDSAFRSSLRTLFEAHHEFMVCGDTGDAEEAIKKANKLQPGLIILDSALASINGFETAKALNSALPSVRLFLLMDEYSFGAEKEALHSGIYAVFAKDEDLTCLIANARVACGIKDSGAGIEMAVQGGNR